MTISKSLNVVSGGIGTPESVADMSTKKTVVVSGLIGTIVIEAGINGDFCEKQLIQAPSGEVTFDVVAEEVRVNAQNGAAATVVIAAEDGVPSFAELPAPAGPSEAGVAVDGPMGPYHIVKRGPVQLAAQLGWQIVPASVASRHKYVFRHRWDRLEIPKPLSRVCLKIGEPICIPSNLTTGELHHWTRRLHDILEDDEREAQRKVRSSYAATASSLRSPHG